MRTTFRKKSNLLEARQIGYFVLAVLLGVAVYFSRPVMVKFATPFWRIRDNVFKGADNFFGLFRNKDDLITENTALRTKLASYDFLVLSYKALESSRDSLLAEFGRPVSGNEVAASVLVHPPQTSYDLIIIDAGSSNGVVKGDTVSLPEGGVIGVVEDALDNSSRVRLYSSSGVETKGYLERTNDAVVLTGVGSGTLTLKAPKNIQVVEGDRIFSAALRSELLGVVKKVEAKATDAEQTVSAALPVNIYNLRYVIVKK